MTERVCEKVKHRVCEWERESEREREREREGQRERKRLRNGKQERERERETGTETERYTPAHHILLCCFFGSRSAFLSSLAAKKRKVSTKAACSRERGWLSSNSIRQGGWLVVKRWRACQISCLAGCSASSVLLNKHQLQPSLKPEVRFLQIQAKLCSDMHLVLDQTK